MIDLLKKLSFPIVIGSVVLSFPAYSHAFSVYNETVDGDLSNNRLAPTQLGSLTLGTNSLKATFKGGLDTPDPDYFTFTIPKGQLLSSIILKSWHTEPYFEDIAFIGMTKGSTFNFSYSAATGGTNNPNPATGLLGWSHLRSTQVGTNKILTEMSLSNLKPSESGLDIVANQEADNNPYTPEQLANLDPNDPNATEEILKSNLRRVGTEGTPGSTIGWFPGATGFDLPLEAGDYSIWLRQGSATRITTELEFNTRAVPEPMTMLGVGTALGIGAFFKRTVSKKQKKINKKTS